MNAYGFWWFGKAKVWCHTLDVDGEFFEKFVEERIRPLVGGKAIKADEIDVNAMSEADKQALLAKLMGK
jgi:hypothetical protein